MSKPLTIDELKALEVGDWVWIMAPPSPFDKGMYVRKHEASNIEFFKGETLGWFFADGYETYGKWIAYKNKEQAKCMGEIVELPCKLGQKLYAIYDDKIHEYSGAEINVHEDGRFIFETPTLFPKRLTFGKDVFLDKVEAERRLAELKGE